MILGVNISMLCMLIIANLTGQMIISYKGLSDKYHWPIGRLFDTGSATWVNVAGIALYIVPLVQCFLYNPWWSAALCWLISASFGTVISKKLRHNTQIVSIALIPIAIVCVIWVYYMHKGG